MLHFIAVQAFILGGNALAYEYNLSKLSSDLTGQSITHWALTIAMMMFFMGIGTQWQRRIPEKLLLRYFLSFQILSSTLGVISPFAVVYAFSYSQAHFYSVYLMAIAGVGFFIGCEIPLLVRWSAQYRTGLKNDLGRVFFADYLGALVGALLWVFFLVPRFDTIATSIILSGVNLCLASLMLYFLWARFNPKFRVGCLGLKIILAISLAIAWQKVPQFRSWTDQALYSDPVIYSDQSVYQRMTLTKSRAGNLKLFLNGNLQFSSFDEHIYHENLVHPAMSLAYQRTRVLILGGGDGLALREVLKYPDVKAVDLCDLDKKVTQLGAFHPQLQKLNHNAFKDARVKTHLPQLMPPQEKESLSLKDRSARTVRISDKSVNVGVYNFDAVYFLQQFEGLYDVILLDFPDPSSPALSKLYAREFYLLLKKHLARGGVLAQQSTHAVFTQETFLSIGKTLESASFHTLPYHEYIPSFGGWGFWLAAHHKLEKTEMVPAVATRFITRDSFLRAQQFGKDFDWKRGLVNTQINHHAYNTYLRGWKKHL